MTTKRKCLTSVRYSSEDDAYAARHNIRRKYGREVSVFRCEHCRGWHHGQRREQRARNLVRVIEREIARI